MNPRPLFGCPVKSNLSNNIKNLGSNFNRLETAPNGVAVIDHAQITHTNHDEKHRPLCLGETERRRPFYFWGSTSDWIGRANNFEVDPMPTIDNFLGSK